MEKLARLLQSIPPDALARLLSSSADDFRDTIAFLIWLKPETPAAVVAAIETCGLVAMLPSVANA